MPTDSRTRSAGHLERRAGGAGVGHPARVLDQRLDAAERLGQREQLRPLADLQRGVLAVPQPERDHPAEAGHLLAPRRRARGASGSPGYSTAATAGWPSRNSATRAALAECRSIRTPRVLRLRSTSHESNGLGHRAHRVLVVGQPLAELGVARRRARRRRRRSARRGTWSSSGRRRPRRASAAAAGRARRRCCRRRAARRPRARPPRWRSMSVMFEQRVGRRLAPDHPGRRPDRRAAPRRGRRGGRACTPGPTPTSTREISRNVPPYASPPRTTWSPGRQTVRSRVSSAASPDAKASAVVPSSSAASASCSAVRVGLPLRLYS